MQPDIERILLVDDDPDDAFLMQKALEEINPGLHFHSIDDCDELLAALTLHQPGLVFLDINMPRKNGFECLQLLREQGLSVPVVMYSCSNQGGHVLRAYEAGATLYLQKTDTFRELVSALADILNLDWSAPDAIRTRFSEGTTQL